MITLLTKRNRIYAYNGSDNTAQHSWDWHRKGISDHSHAFEVKSEEDDQFSGEEADWIESSQAKGACRYARRTRLRILTTKIFEKRTVEWA